MSCSLTESNLKMEAETVFLQLVSIWIWALQLKEKELCWYPYKFRLLRIFCFLNFIDGGNHFEP